MRFPEWGIKPIDLKDNTASSSLPQLRYITNDRAHHSEWSQTCDVGWGLFGGGASGEGLMGVNPKLARYYFASICILYSNMYISNTRTQCFEIGKKCSTYCHFYINYFALIFGYLVVWMCFNEGPAHLCGWWEAIEKTWRHNECNVGQGFALNLTASLWNKMIMVGEFRSSTTSAWQMRSISIYFLSSISIVVNNQSQVENKLHSDSKVLIYENKTSIHRHNCQ